MSPIRSLLLHLDASQACAKRLAIANHLLADLDDTRLSVLYACTPAMLEMPFALAESSGEALLALQALDDERRDRAKGLCDQAFASSSSRIAWHEPKHDPIIRGVIHHALLADLLILGQHDANERASGVPADFVPSVIVASGRPALVVPYVGNFSTIGRDALIAWKATRESARAVSAALPLLRGARRVHVTAPSEVGLDGEGSTVDDLEQYLRQHGISAPIQKHGPLESSSPGEGLLSLAANTNADLLVMGCYGHSRARELILGGATRTILQSMTLPVLMAH